MIVQYKEFSGGRGFQTEPKTTSDYLTYSSIKPKNQGENTMSYNIVNEKKELVQKCKDSIDKLTRQIESLKTDKSMTESERQKKIARRLDIIAGYNLTIQNAQEYIRRETQRIHKIYEHQMNKMK